MVKTALKTSKSILNRLEYIDSWFWCRYTMNPYQGCEHACVYCDARSSRYYIHEDFDETIHIKKNMAEILTKTLKKLPKTKKDVIAMAGMCDGYQPIEETAKKTQNALKIISAYRYPITLITKNKLVTRDTDLLEEIAKKSWASVGFTITSTNPEIASFLEPKASSVEDRFKAMKLLTQKTQNLHVGVILTPIIPLLEDSLEN